MLTDFKHDKVKREIVGTWWTKVRDEKSQEYIETQTRAHQTLAPNGLWKSIMFQLISGSSPFIAFSQYNLFPSLQIRFIKSNLNYKCNKENA